MPELIVSILPSVATLTAAGFLFGILLSYAKLKLKVEKDPLIEKIIEELPGANCGACGLPGCSAYATRIVEEKYDINLCPVGGQDLITRVASILGVEAVESGVPLKARVACQGGIGVTSLKFIYEGPKTCTAANGLMGGFKVCEFGCLGLGDCEISCPFDAIHIQENGLPQVDDAKCTGCGNCVTACPRNIISLVKETFDVHVLCRNMEKAPVMKLGCSVGCIACRLCVKACTEIHKDNPHIDTAITVEDFIATIDYDKCINCLECARVCPVSVISPIEVSKKNKKAGKTGNTAETGNEINI